MAGKALGSVGGYVVGPRPAIDYLRSTAPGFIFTTALPPALLAAWDTALTLVQGEVGADLREGVRTNVGYLKQLAAPAGHPVPRRRVALRPGARARRRTRQGGGPDPALGTPHLRPAHQRSLGARGHRAHPPRSRAAAQAPPRSLPSSPRSTPPCASIPPWRGAPSSPKESTHDPPLRRLRQDGDPPRLRHRVPRPGGRRPRLAGRARRHQGLPRAHAPGRAAPDAADQRPAGSRSPARSASRCPSTSAATATRTTRSR
ncbi:aminotransferase class I/II-fold pyridoxal phosphate-dependent enzyme [Nocardioides sp. W3-2-3]|nr:aminotransferase class I/II-fold pyridoxal phosphate-dependent enzyme [Nocardioides convexus]